MNSQDILEAFLLGAAVASKDASAIGAIPPRAWRTVHEKVINDATTKKSKDHLKAWLKTQGVMPGESVLESVIEEVRGRYQARQATAADLAARLSGNQSLDSWLQDVTLGAKR